jgi:hypothetical protein
MNEPLRTVLARRIQQRVDRLWVLGRRSTVAYVRLYPNFGFMLPIGRNRRLRWSRFYGWAITQAPRLGNPKGV